MLPRHLGDAVLALPALRQLARVSDLLIRADGGAARVLAGQGPWRIGPDRRSAWLPLPTLLLSGSLRVAVTAIASRAPIRVGRGTDGRKHALTHRVPAPPTPLAVRNPSGRKLPGLLPREHQADEYLRAARLFAEAAGLAPLAPEQGDDRLRITADDGFFGQRWLDQTGASVLLHPWAAGLPTKRWALERWVELGERLRGAGEQVAVTGGPDPDDAREARILAGRLGVPVAAGEGTLPIAVWAAAALRAKRVVLPDTGLAHVAAAAGASSVVLFGATDPARHGPRGAGPARVLHRDLACGPCYRPRCAGPDELACLAWKPARVAQEVLA